MGGRAIRARSKTVLDKPSFRSLAVERRVLVSAESCGEWLVGDNEKLPTYLQPQDRGIAAFAGLYECWSDLEFPESGEKSD